MQNIKHRPRRLRSFPLLRNIVAETSLSAKNLIAPLFLKEGISKPQPISSMPGVMQYPVKQAAQIAQEWQDKGVHSILVFGIPEKKDPTGKSAFDPKGPVPTALRAMKKKCGDQILLIADVCLCEYTAHGHCGVLSEKHIANDATLPLLAKTAICYASAGADIIAPSDMMDGRIGFIRTELDTHNHQNTPLMSYSVKYASALYGPFRDAAENIPTFGDRRSYQMDARNRREALRETLLDEKEGADFIMVKPGGWYLDVLSDLRKQTSLPLVGYQVSGEYGLICAAAEKGWMDQKQLVLESLYAYRRAGADLIISYFTPQVVTWSELK